MNDTIATPTLDDAFGPDVDGAFGADGYVALRSAVDADACRALLRSLREGRAFGPGLFLSEDAFARNPERRGVNPRPGRNILEGRDLRFVEDNPVVRALLNRLVGPEPRVVMRKLVCSVPAPWLPPYVAAEIREAPVAMLGPWIRPEYRDVTYFHGIDYHQDIIDYRNRPSDFVTLYVYLDDVTESDSPLVVLPGSHVFGATVFPHDLAEGAGEDGAFTYSDRRGRSRTVEQRVLTGPAGSVAAWHPCLLHGTQPVTSPGARLSVRYILERTNGTGTVLDAVNRDVLGPLALEETRVDVDADANIVLRGNAINAQRLGPPSPTGRDGES